MDDEDLPLLGEPAAIELANTWYGEGDELIDFLGDPPVARRWVALALGDVPEGDLADLRAVRDAARTLITARCDGRPLDPRAVEVVNAQARRACARVVLIAEERVARTTLDGDAAARLAVSCIEVVTGPEAIRRCEGPGCTLFFVQTHGRRRFCHDGCSHRQRQSRYRRSRK